MAPAVLRRLKGLVPDRHPARLAWHHSKAFIAALSYGFPARRLTIIAVTGTDGKTTTVGMVAHILHAAGLPCGALSTAFLRVRDRITVNETQKTSPSPFQIQRFLRRLVDARCTYAVLECSSHGLVQGRMNWTWPRVSAITNTALEHLDYHGTMEQYRTDKGILFRMLRGKGAKILNRRDDTYALYRQIPSPRTVVYSSQPSRAQEGEDTLWLTDVAVGPAGTAATVHRAGEVQTWPLSLPIPGVFNLENALCAIGCAMSVGVHLGTAAGALRTFRAGPGRMERIDEGQPFSVFIDFAITPQAFEKTLSTVRQLIGAGKRILVLTGACGRRMREKRPIIGQLCSRLAEVVVITDDEPYDEDPLRIMDELWSGIDQSRAKARKIPDRREAIRWIFSEARRGDAVVLCGLGSYPTRQMRDTVIPWNEQEIARELLSQLQQSIAAPASEKKEDQSAIAG